LSRIVLRVAPLAEFGKSVERISGLWQDRALLQASMITIVMPTLNEAALLPSTLSPIAANSTAHEILVADGGSTDDTVKVAEAAGARVLRCPAAHRARQMNRAAREAQGDVLLFLHADTWLRPDSLLQVRTALARAEVVGDASTDAGRCAQLCPTSGSRSGTWRAPMQTRCGERCGCGVAAVRIRRAERDRSLGRSACVGQRGLGEVQRGVRRAATLRAGTARGPG
jgi:cellulose synthase/poly-beta-1,6-N-acetylglucosamine synthase-like glycosyltransferase